uniref:UDP-galactopyranose mutase C-terminal domain-containing protein n=2 Tax=Ciona intestinalis TaxID=7719 RepID=H2XJK6_CIOIN
MDLYERYRQLAVKEEEGKNVHFVGRLANYKYMNMDQAIRNALDFFDRINDKVEKD